MKGNYDFQDPFSSSFNYMKVRYQEYDDVLTDLDFLCQNDKVSLFINLETVFKHLSMINDLERKLFACRDFDVLFISNFLNLAAHYKRFLVSNTLDTKIYLYYTDMESKEFHESEINEDYRSYYINKYNNNPRFVYMTDGLKFNVLPNLKTYATYIPNVYCISAKNIEGSLVPLIISKTEPDRKPIVLSSEFYDSQYLYIDRFHLTYLSRTQTQGPMHSDVKFFLNTQMRQSGDSETIQSLSNVYDNYAFYCSFLSCVGDRDRSIDGVEGIGPATLGNYLKNALLSNTITKSSDSIALLSEIFKDPNTREEFKVSYLCSCLEQMYQRLTETEIQSITDQIVDKSDINTLQSINRTKFSNHPIMLDSLLM